MARRLFPRPGTGSLHQTNPLSVQEGYSSSLPVSIKTQQRLCRLNRERLDRVTSLATCRKATRVRHQQGAIPVITRRLAPATLLHRHFRPRKRQPTMARGLI